MTNVVLKLKDTEIKQLMSKIKFEQSKLPQGMKAKCKYKGVTINIYNSNKVMFQGKTAQEVSNQLLGHQASQSTPSSASSHPTIPYNQYSCIGSDEAGSGDYFGPLTVCASYVSKDQIPLLKTLGVDDSKRLNDTKIVELAEQLVTFIPHSLITLDNVKYNERKALGWSQVKMKAVLHNACITNVLNKIDQTELDYIVIDQFAKREVYKHYALTEIPCDKKTKFETKGESKSLSIAVASIISRYAFVKHMEQIEHKLKLDIPKGASAKVDLQAAKLIQKYDINTLDTYSKRHFKNRDKALDILNKRGHSK
ncbi:ribonuclease HIII [Staphylococcus massiliensis]|uniref:Ribonuclease HIII n=1 Tax=Staphylococcus massiliensis S46 TaxID=1229783 RepID=K9AJC5_9STAP|nr:ribonuclease HIII [Staphylococcus massiliensis]EKU46201.1 ribonuclease HIII [Staphylococcus massiliensis S46]MCG3400560.1 ribonuclease HIII [Staphylococcus massiliensis]MCG3401447.1 ribonuclease HIII [Staphylococcus massiliensis]MCG3411770.1 ribonuclease HIII [Staphylococcus massiliensis]POA01734.1 ribonuclease HIII [Staphylococcus massiliensis CCUG 55927]